MSISHTRLGLLFVVLAIGHPPAFASVCEKRFTQLDSDSVHGFALPDDQSEAYAALVSKDRFERQAQVPPLLHRALRPLMDDLRDFARTVPDQELDQMIVAVERDRRIEKVTRVGIDDDFEILQKIITPEQYLAGGGLKTAFLHSHMFNQRNPGAYGQSPTLMWMRDDPALLSDLGTAVPSFRKLITPVGEYGEDFAKKRQVAAAVLMRLADMRLRPTSKKLYDRNKKLLNEESARARRATEEQSAEGMAPLAAMNEGILSLHQLVGALTGEKIPGIATGSQAMRELVAGDNGRIGFLSQITLRLRQGHIGPTGSTGRYFKNPAKFADGKLSIQPAFEDFLKKMTGGRKGVCPFAGLFGKATTPAPELKTPIQELAEIYLRIFDRMDAHASPNP